MTLTALAEQLPTILLDFPAISLIYVFGSQVKGEIGPMSDYDLAILDESSQDEIELQTRFQHTVTKLVGTDRVDVVLLHHAPIELAYHVIASGKLLYQKSLVVRVEFEAQVLGKYGDYLPTLKDFQRQILDGDPHAKRVQRYREALRRTERTLGQAGTFPKSTSD